MGRRMSVKRKVLATLKNCIGNGDDQGGGSILWMIYYDHASASEVYATDLTALKNMTGNVR
jgi:hypothetical protein